MQGVYKITNTLNGKVYIGQSINIKSRWQSHKRNWKYKASKLNDAIYIDGLNNFSFDVIEEVKKKDDLLLREKYWKDYYNSVDNGYNSFKGIETNKNLWEHAKKSNVRSDIERQKKPIIIKPSKEEVNKYKEDLKQYHRNYKQYRLEKLHNKTNIFPPKKPTKPTSKIIKKNFIKESVVIHYPPRKGKKGIDREVVYV